MPFATSRWLAYWPLAACVLLAVFLLSLSPSRETAAALVILAWLGLCLLAWCRARTSRSAPLDGTQLVAYASQGGQARQIAERSAEQLTRSGVHAQALPLNQLSDEDLAGQTRLFLVLATYGEGESPDNGNRFLRLLERQPRLRELSYTLLGLGDSSYQHFCGFARSVDERLRQLQALPLFERLEADQLHPATLSQWQWQLGQLSGDPNYEEWHPPAFTRWRLTERECLNPGSQGAPVYRLRLRGEDGLARWQAGDIAEIAPRLPATTIRQRLGELGLTGVPEEQIHALATRRWPEDLRTLAGSTAEQLLETLPRLNHRDYSIASLPAEGAIELLVRLTHTPDGQPGLGSGWLCLHAAPGEIIDLRIRVNPGFRLPEQCGPLILIGNGTGLAGLRAHLCERQALGQHGHWLLYGERNAAFDSLLNAQLQAWLDSGHLARLDRVYSRDQPERLYVQHQLREHAETLRQWMDQGATLLVCGSLEGMGREVDALLRGLLGSDRVDELTRAGRYRKDLY